MPVTIGRYRLSKTLGIGAFGKVKCEFVFSIFHVVFFCFSELAQQQYSYCCTCIRYSNLLS